MKRRFRLDVTAHDDLQQIYEYVARDNPPAARRLLDRFREAFTMLGRNPNMGQARPELAAKIRSFTIGKYVLYFRPVDRGVEIARVLHGARDVTDLFP